MSTDDRGGAGSDPRDSRDPLDSRGSRDRAPVRRFLELPATARRVQREVDEEIRFHLESRVADLVARGVRPDVAREQAAREFGDVGEARSELATVDRRRAQRSRRAAWWEGVGQDLAYSMRSLRKQPGYTAVVVLVLALGIGANATMFGVIDRLLLRPPAHVADPGRLMHVSTSRLIQGVEGRGPVLSYPIFRDVRAADAAFEHVAAYSATDFALGRGPDAERLRGMRVSANYFAALGVRPAVGRFFLPEEDGDPTAPEVVVLSHGFWQRRFDGDRGVVGRTLPLGDGQFTVVGVAPEGFAGLDAASVDVWVPLTTGVTAAEHTNWLASRHGYWLLAVGRLRDGVTPERAEAIATAALRAGAQRDGESPAEIAAAQHRVRLVSTLPREARANRPVSRVSVLLGAVSLLVLLIACANAANLQLARGLARRREIAVRVALGIERRRLVRQLALESVALALIAGAASVAVTIWVGRFVRDVVFTAVAWTGPAVDARLLGYTVLAAVVAGVLSGLVPVAQVARMGFAGGGALAGALRAGARSGSHQRSSARSTLLVVQGALTVVLLVGTGLFVLSLQRIEGLPLGLEADRVLVAQLRTSGMSYTFPEIDALYRRLEEVARATPGVESAAIGGSLPFSSSWAEVVSVPGLDSVPLTRDGGPYFNAVTEGFFATLGTRIVRGRGLTAADRTGAHRVVVVNQTLASLWWPNEDAIGKCMKVGGDSMPCSEVVGIAENARRQDILEEPSVQYYLPLEQAPAWVETRTLFIRPARDAGPMREPLRRRLQAGVPNLPYIDVQTLEEMVSPQTRSWRLGATMFGAFGLLALAVAALGLYSVLAYDVSRRTHEMGVRIALGARGADLARMIVGRAVGVAAVGAAIGFALALAVGSTVEPLLYETSPREPLIFAAVAVVLLVVSVLAALIPTRRAVGVDPIVALRTE